MVVRSGGTQSLHDGFGEDLGARSWHVVAAARRAAVAQLTARQRSRTRRWAAARASLELTRVICIHCAVRLIQTFPREAQLLPDEGGGHAPPLDEGLAATGERQRWPHGSWQQRIGPSRPASADARRTGVDVL